MIYGDKFLLNESLIPDGEKRRIFDGTRKAMNRLFKENDIKAKGSIKYHDKYTIANNKFLTGKSNEFVYMVTCPTIKEGKGPIIKWINSNKSTIKKEIEKEIDFKVSKIEVVSADNGLVRGSINVSIKYDLGY